MKQISKGRSMYLVMKCAVVAVALLATLMPVGLRAQSAASISGTVADTSGAVISGAQVVLMNSDTNVKQVTVTNGRGVYSIINVAPGNYSIEVTKNGFGSVIEKTVLSVNQSALSNFKMVPGSIEQTVTVSADSSSVQSTTATLGTVIGTKSVNDLPLNGRNFTQMLELTPGVSRIGVSQAVLQNGGQTSHIIGTYTLPAVNGQRNRANMFLMDGGNDLNSFNGSFNYQPIVDAIQEFKVQSHSDLAEFGQVTGGIVNVVTKSGTNRFHGSLWEFVRNSAFDARDYFQPKVNPLHQHQFGGSVGGPVWIPHLYNGRDRTFFFFAYEGYRQSQSSQAIVTTPTPAQLNGDFSNLLAKGVLLYDPYSTRPDPAQPGKYLRDAFPGNQIPTSRISNAALVYAKSLFPAPVSGVVGGNAYDNTPIRTSSRSYTGRLDQTLGSRDFFFVRASYFNEPYTQSGGVPGTLRSNVVRGYNIVASEVHTFGPTATLEVHFARNQGDLAATNSLPGVPAGFTQKLIDAGFSSTFLTGYVTPTKDNIPGIGITGYLGLNPAGFADINGSDVYEYTAAFSKLVGKHTLKLGGIFAINGFHGTIAQNSETMTTFQTSNLETPTVNGVQTGDALASFLVGAPNAVLRRNTASVEHGGFTTGGYLQDQFKISQRLSLNVGVRWDMAAWPIFGNLKDGTGYVGNMDLNKGIYYLSATPPACSSSVGAPCIPGGALPDHVQLTPYKGGSLHGTSYDNWQGRVGFAYQFTPAISVHAGYGRFYDEWSFIAQNSQSVSGQWPSVGLLSVGNLNQTTVTAPIADPLNLGSTSIVPAATPFLNSGAFYRRPDLLSPYSDQWNLGVEQVLDAKTKFTLGYVGSSSKDLVLAGIANTATFPAAGTPAQVASRRPFPYILPSQFYDSTGYASYHSLQTTLNRRSSNGLSYLISYTWSKSIDLACSGSVNATACLLQDWYHPENDRSVSSYDLPHIFSASVVYELPFGKGRRFTSSNSLVNFTLGGWQVNTITSLSSGTPYSIKVNGDNANTGNNFVKPNLVGNPTPVNRTAQQWINPSAFQTPARYSFGTFGRNALRSNWFRDVDLSLFKSFPITEEVKLNFHAEAFNLTNTAMFAAPNNILGTPTFGAVSSTVYNPRQLQFALKLEF